MTSPSARKGRGWERDIEAFLQERGFESAERDLRKGLHKDEGDIIGIPELCIEAKNAKRLDLAGWANERDVETVNKGARYGVLVVKRPRKPSPADAYWIVDGETFVALLKEAGIEGC